MTKLSRRAHAAWKAVRQDATAQDRMLAYMFVRLVQDFETEGIGVYAALISCEE